MSRAHLVQKVKTNGLYESQKFMKGDLPKTTKELFQIYNSGALAAVKPLKSRQTR